VPVARRWLTGLVAAAAVVVAAAGFGAVLRHGGLTSAPTASEARGPSTAQQATGGSQGTAGPPGVSNSTAKKGSATHTRYFAFDRSLAGARRVRSASIKADVTRIVNARVPQRVDGLKAVPHSLSAHLPARARCSAPRTHHGDQILAIRFDGARALLVVSAARHGTREAQIYSCGNTSTPVAHTRVATGGTPR
jgi:hypothetical protein